ncbi:MAG TPA: type II toxin-antitoxin system VapB family antitoxin [Azospirillaceae bacterium]|nr:type II toxin-antitoxin system VapB family antitoxin [Azospirillaceae bacterium]
MRTNIDIDDDLLREAMEITGLRTKKETVEEALRRLVMLRRQKKAVQESAGIGWDGDLDAMRDVTREGRSLDPGR